MFSDYEDEILESFSSFVNDLGLEMDRFGCNVLIDQDGDTLLTKLDLEKLENMLVDLEDVYAMKATEQCVIHEV